VCVFRSCLAPTAPARSPPRRVRRLKNGDQVYAYDFDNPKGGFYAEYVALLAERVGHVTDGAGSYLSHWLGERAPGAALRGRASPAVAGACGSRVDLRDGCAWELR
jgi:hypothetical protein